MDRPADDITQPSAPAAQTIKRLVQLMVTLVIVAYYRDNTAVAIVWSFLAGLYFSDVWHEVVRRRAARERTKSR